MMTLRRFSVGVGVLAALWLVGWSSQRDFARQGDGWEYLAMVEALARHASPEVRADDLEALFGGIEAWQQTRTHGSVRDIHGAELPHGFVRAPDGRSHAAHFWMYSLFALPARLALGALGGRVFNALVVTNAWMFVAALGTVLFAAGGSLGRRTALALLLAATPVAWYVTFTGAEVFCWALAVVALVCLERDRHAAAALAAGIAATQNPPMALLAAVPVILSMRRRSWAATLAALAGASVAVLPVAYNWWHFGQPSLIAATLDLGLVSPGRTAGLLLDLNTGLLPYVPVLLVASAWGSVRLTRQRDGWALLVGLAVVGMLLAVQTQINWNTDGRGLRRYLVWVLPPLAWMVVNAWPGRLRAGIVAAAVAWSGAVLILDPPTDTSWLEHRPLARWMMRTAPLLYNPDFETFTERSVHGEAPPQWLLEGRRDGWKVALPVAHGRSTGEVTKLLVQRDSRAELPRRFRIEPAYLPELLAIADASVEPTYVHPPAGAVWAAPGSIDGICAPYRPPPSSPPVPE